MWDGHSYVREPKPAFWAARALTHMLDGYQFDERLAVGDADDYVLEFVKGDETASSRASCDRGHLPAYRQVTVYRLWFVLSQATTCRLRARLQRGQNQANLLSVSEKQIGLLHREHSADGASAVLAPLCRAVGRPWLVSTFSRWVREGASATGQPERAFGRRFARGERGRVHAWLGG